jgi:bla regulator protein BlaR1
MDGESAPGAKDLHSSAGGPASRYMSVQGNKWILRRVEARMTKISMILLLAASLCLSRNSFAQEPAATLQAYDVVVVRENNTLSRDTSVNVEDSTFRATNVTLKFLLVVAYGIREGQISGLPGWADTVRFDVNAKVTEPDLKVLHNLTLDQQKAMLIAVLIDRFHLQSHIETKTMPVYDLLVAKDGSKLKPSAVPPDPVNPDNPSLGEISVNHNSDLTASNVKITQLAGNLAFPLDRTVIDKTGLTGRYDFHLQWTPDNIRDNATDNGAAEAPPDIFTAIQEQLGLKLESAKGPVKILVIDHAEKPSDN